MNIFGFDLHRRSAAPAHGLKARLKMTTAVTGLMASLLLASMSPQNAVFAQASDAGLRALIDARRFDEAITRIEELQADGEAVAATYMTLAEIYIEQGAGIAAEAAIDRARRLGADYAQTAVPFAKTQLLQNKFADALGALRGVNIPDGARAEASVVAGDAHLALKNKPEAENSYKLAKQEDPNSFKADLGLARIALERGQLDEAGRLAAAARSLAPDNTMVRYTEGLIARYKGNIEEAEGHFLAAQKLFPDNVLANIELAAMRVDQGRLEEAQAYLDAIFAIAPQHPMAQYLSGTILASQGKYVEADALFNASRRVTEKYLPARYTRGMVAFQLGKYDIAVNLLQDVVKARPGNMPARLALATSQLRQKRPQAALNTLAPVLDDQTVDVNILGIAARSAVALGDAERGEALYSRLAAAGGSEAENTDLDLRLAMAKYVAGQKQEALSTLIEARGNTSNDLRSLAVLAGMQLRDEDYSGAQATISILIDTAPDRALGYNLMGSMQYSQGRYQEALRSFEQAVSRNPDYYTAIRNKALARIQINDLSGAESDLKRLLEITPSDARAKAMLGRVLLRRDKPSEAVDYFNDAVRAIPGSVDIWADYSEARAGAGQTADAIEQAKDTAVMGENRPDILKRMGLLLLSLNEARIAVRPLSRYVAFYPDSGEAHLMHGRALLAMGLYTGSKTSFARAAAAERDIPDTDTLAWYLFAADALAQKYESAGLKRAELDPRKRPEDISPSIVGDFLLASGRPGEAETAYRAAMRDGDDSSLAIGLARALEAQDQRGEAIETLEKFVSRVPSSREARMALGQKLERAGQIAAAAEQYEAILRGGVADALVAARLANAYLLTGNRRSVPLAERAYLIRPEDPFILDTYGWIMLQAARDTTKSIEALEKAIRRAPASAQYRFHLGMAYLARGRRDDAAEAFREALRLDADFPDATEAQRQLDLMRR